MPESVDLEPKGHSLELHLLGEEKERLLEPMRAVEGPWCQDDFHPHVSLSVIRSDADPEKLREIARVIASKTSKLDLRISTLGAFPGKRPVFYLGIAANRDLLDAHHLTISLLDEAGIEPIPYYRKNHWTPHITIMMGRPRREVSAALEDLSRVRFPGNYQFRNLDLIEFHPAIRLERLKLHGVGS